MGMVFEFRVEVAAKAGSHYTRDTIQSRLDALRTMTDRSSEHDQEIEYLVNLMQRDFPVQAMPGGVAVNG